MHFLPIWHIAKNSGYWLLFDFDYLIILDVVYYHLSLETDDEDGCKLIGSWNTSNLCPYDNCKREAFALGLHYNCFDEHRPGLSSKYSNSYFKYQGKILVTFCSQPHTVTSPQTGRGLKTFCGSILLLAMITIEFCLRSLQSTLSK